MSPDSKGMDNYTATEDINISFTRQYAGTRDYHNSLVIDDAYDQKDTSITSMYLDHKIYDKSERYGYTLVQNVNNGKTINDCQDKRTYYYQIQIVVEGYEF